MLNSWCKDNKGQTVWFTQCLNYLIDSCESGSSCFHPGEGPSRGLLYNCETLRSFVSSFSGGRVRPRPRTAAPATWPRCLTRPPTCSWPRWRRGRGWPSLAPDGTPTRASSPGQTAVHGASSPGTQALQVLNIKRCQQNFAEHNIQDTIVYHKWALGFVKNSQHSQNLKKKHGLNWLEMHFKHNFCFYFFYRPKYEVWIFPPFFDATAFVGLYFWSNYM